MLVREDSTILHALLEQGMDAAFSCGQGICGTCETAVLAGTPDHRDFVLSEAEKQSGQVMMICCSRAFTDEIVIDL